MIAKYEISIVKINAFILSLLIIGTITGPAVYIGDQEIQFFRLIMIVSVVAAIIMSLRYQIFLSEPSTVLLGFFSIYFLWTALISIATSSVRVNDFFNFFIVYQLIIVIIVFMNYNYNSFMHILYKTSIGMAIVMFGIAVWEIITHNHLKGSFSNYNPEHIAFLPTTFFTNSNDMMAILTLIVLYVVGYSKVYRRPVTLAVYFVLLFSIMLSFITSARLAMLVLVSILLILFLQKINVKKVLTIGLIVAVGLLTLINFFGVEYIYNALTFGGHSTFIRSYLYLDAFDSIEIYRGIGAGINNSSEFYQQLSDKRLDGIINPHNYLLEILINSGVVIIFLYFLLNLYFSILFLKQKQYFLIFMLFIYQIILIASSNSLFLWFHYVYFISLIGLYMVSVNFNDNKKAERVQS